MRMIGSTGFHRGPERNAHGTGRESHSQRKSMRRRFYTIFILPHAHARFRKLHLSRNFVAVSCAVLALGLIGGGVAPHLLFRVQAQSVVLSDLEAENRALRDHKNRFETALEQMAQRLDQVESEASRLAREMGVKDLPGGRPAA